MEQIIQLSYALDTFYFLVSGALVMWMAAGFSMLEAGLVRSKNTVEILTKNIALFSIACVMYMLIGYNLMYPDTNDTLFPSINFLLGGDNNKDSVVASNGEIYYSNMSDFFFQVVFVSTAMSIISGTIAERMKLVSFLLFAVFFTAFIYPIQGYWKWGGGFLDALGFADFAGAGVVHMAGATAALAAVFLLGARYGKYTKDGKSRALVGANTPLATLGTFILWFGWFGFNGGSELQISNIDEANAVALIFVNTNMAAAGGVIVSLCVSKLWFGKADLSMILNGALAGLVSITAEPLTPSVLSATVIGGVGGLLVVIAIVLLDKVCKIDDPVGAISVHGVCGIWGLLAVCFTNEEATLSAQLIGIATIFAWVFATSLVVWLVLKVTIGIRVSKEDEVAGLDIVECGQEAYPEFHHR